MYSASFIREAAELMDCSIADIRANRDVNWAEGSDTPKDWKAMLNQLATIIDYMPFVIDALSAQQAECNPSGETMMKCAEFIEKIKKMEKNDD